jgi:hypothetical protein
METAAHCYRASRYGKAIARLRRILATDPRTYWRECCYYIQAAGVSDSRFYAVNFDQQLTSVVLAQIEFIQQRDRQVANDASYTLSLLLPAFSSTPLLSADLVPYPSPKQALDTQTAQVIAKLLSQGKLNRKVVSILGGLNLLPDKTINP